MKNIKSNTKMEFDLESLFTLRHLCKSDICKERKNCCASYEICIDSDELDRIISYVPLASNYATHLKTGSEYNNIFEETDDGLVSLDRDENGLCVFAYTNSENHTLCSLHSVAIDHKLPHYSLKPRSCALWPLSLVSNGSIYLSVDEDAHLFPCNSFSHNEATICRSVGKTVENLFGERVLHEILEEGKLNQKNVLGKSSVMSGKRKR